MTTPFIISLISTEAELAGEAEVLHTALQAATSGQAAAPGLQVYVHCRKPGWSQAQRAAWLRPFTTATRRQVAVHTGPTEAAELGCVAHHPMSAHSRSAHTVDELVAWRRHCRFAFLSPIFSSTSKPGYGPAFTDAVLKSALSNEPCCPAVALGGVTPERIQQVKNLGFAGAAVLGWLWQEGVEQSLQRCFQFMQAAAAQA